MNKLDKNYTALLQDILDNGVKKETRNGGTISVFGRQIRHKMSEGFPLLTTKKMPWKSIVTELLWFLRGDTNIKYLVDNGCNIWNGDAYKNYLNKAKNYTTEDLFYNKLSGVGDVIEGTLEAHTRDFKPYTQEEFIDKIKTDDEFAKTWGELGPIYGKQWRRWEGYKHGMVLGAGLSKEQPIDQIQNLINDLKGNPDSRRLMVNAWNVGELDQMVLPPCHYGFQVYTRELSAQERLEWVKTNLPNVEVNGFVTDDKYSHKWIETLDVNIPTRAISLMWNQRSVDTFLGLPFNIASYGLLLMMIADEVNMVPDQLIGNLGDVHLYSNHIEQAKEQIGRKYTHEERTELLKQAMGEENYNKAVDELMPFGGGLSGYYDSYKIPYMAREPYTLPKLKINPNNKMRIGGGIFTYDIGDFTLDNYQSHPTIKAPLSN